MATLGAVMTVVILLGAVWVTAIVIHGAITPRGSAQHAVAALLAAAVTGLLARYAWLESGSLGWTSAYGTFGLFSLAVALRQLWLQWRSRGPCRSHRSV